MLTSPASQKKSPVTLYPRDKAKTPASPSSKSATATTFSRLACEYENLESPYRTRLYHLLGRIYEEGVILIENDSAWAEFCTDVHWHDIQGPTEGDRKKALKWALIRVLGEHKTQEKRISKFWIMFDTLHKQGCRVEDVANEIACRTITGIIEEGGRLRALEKVGDAHPTIAGLSRVTGVPTVERTPATSRPTEEKALAEGQVSISEYAFSVMRIHLNEIEQQIDVKPNQDVALVGKVKSIDGDFCCVVVEILAGLSPPQRSGLDRARRKSL